MKYYTSYAETYHNGQLIGIQNGGHCLTENELPKEETFVLTWENLSEMYHKLNLMCDFNIWNFKKGRLVSFFVDNPFKKNFRDVKEWKTKLDIMVKIEYTDISNSMSIEDVLKWHDAEKAIQYLNERNLKIK